MQPPKKEPLGKGVINRRLFRDLFVDHSNVSLVLRPDGTSLRAVQNERHALDCRTLECAAVFLRRIAPVALEIVLESRAVHHIGELAVLCDAIDGKRASCFRLITRSLQNWRSWSSFRCGCTSWTRAAATRRTARATVSVGGRSLGEEKRRQCWLIPRPALPLPAH